MLIACTLKKYSSKMQPTLVDCYLSLNFENQKAKIMKFRFNQTPIPAVLSLVAALLFAIQNHVEAAMLADDPFLSRSFNISSGELFVSTSGGSIRVEGGSTSNVKVEMYAKSNRHSDSKLKEIIEEDYDIIIERSGSRVEAIAKRKGKGWSWNGISISFVVYTPNDFECELNTSGGSLKISGVSGRSHELKTSGGSITAEDMSGKLIAKTSGGSITVNEHAGEIDVKTSGGSIRINSIRGDIEATTSGGGIRIKDVEGSVYATTSGGSIDAEINKLEDALVLKTSGGSVHAEIPAGLGLDLDLRGNRVNTSLSNFSGESKSDRVRGTVNGGGILVELSTSGGSVNLDYR
jgi:hypothetical protein